MAKHTLPLSIITRSKYRKEEAVSPPPRNTKDRREAQTKKPADKIKKEDTLLQQQLKQAQLEAKLSKGIAEKAEKEALAAKTEKAALKGKLLQQKAGTAELKKKLAEAAEQKLLQESAEKEKAQEIAALKQQLAALKQQLSEAAEQKLLQERVEKAEEEALKAKAEKAEVEKKLLEESAEKEKAKAEQELLQEKVKELEAKSDELTEPRKDEQIPKGKVKEFLVAIIRKPHPNTLTDITLYEGTGAEVNHVGRPPVNGSSTKQMHHVTPYALIKRFIDKLIGDTFDKEEFLSAFVANIGFFLHDNGVCIKNMLNVEEALIEPDVITKTDQDNTYYLFHGASKAELGLSKQKIEYSDYKTEQTRYVQFALTKFAEMILDDNTKLIATETLSNILITLANSRPYATFPTEGNTRNYEARLYNSKKEAEIGGLTNYQVITAQEIKKYLESGKYDKINQCIRIVNNEGHKVNWTIEALTRLSKIIEVANNCIDDSNLELQEAVDVYKEYNFTLKLANLTDTKKLKPYNQELKADNVITATHYHIAKALYNIFDYTALEKFVLVPASKKEKKPIEVYDSAGTKTLVSYYITSGAEHREKELVKPKGYNKKAVFRTEETDLGLLAKLATYHVYFCKQLFSAFETGFVETRLASDCRYITNILKAFTSLLIIDYNIDKTQEATFNSYLTSEVEYFNPNINRISSVMQVDTIGEDSYQDALGILN